MSRSGVCYRSLTFSVKVNAIGVAQTGVLMVVTG